MHEGQARAILEARVAAGGKLVVAHEADWASINRLRAKCHQLDLPTMLANCPGGG